VKALGKLFIRVRIFPSGLELGDHAHQEALLSVRFMRAFLARSCLHPSGMSRSACRTADTLLAVLERIFRKRPGILLPPSRRMNRVTFSGRRAVSRKRLIVGSGGFLPDAARSRIVIAVRADLGAIIVLNFFELEPVCGLGSSTINALTYGEADSEDAGSRPTCYGFLFVWSVRLPRLYAIEVVWLFLVSRTRLPCA